MDSQPHRKEDHKPSVASMVRVALVVVVVLGVLAWVFRGFLWKVIEAFMLNVLPILFTPIILELSVGFVGLFIVLLFCHFRRKDHESEWVYISQVEPEAEMEAIPEPLRKRVGETVLTSKPEIEDKDELPLQAIEGLLELGMLDDAEKELEKLSAEDQRRPEVVKLRLMVLLRQKRWEEAKVLVGGRKLAVPDKLAVACVDVARLFVKQKPSDKEAATQCLDLGKSLSVNAVVNAIDSDGKLQKLA